MPVAFVDEWVPNGPFPIARDTNLLGGYRVVPDVTARDAIVSSRRVVGMLVFVVATTETYRLVGGITNGDWELVDSTLLVVTSTPTITLDLSIAVPVYRTVTVAVDTTFATSNRAAVRRASVRLVSDGSAHSLSFPGAWTFLGANAPTSLAAGKTAVLSVTAYGTAESDVVAAYAVQP